MKHFYLIGTVLFAVTFAASPAFGYYQDQYSSNNNNQQKKVAKHKAAKQYQSRSFNYPATRPASGNKVFIYDPRKLTWAVYNENGQLVRTGPGSSGRNYCPDIGRGCHTPAGTYSIIAKQGPGYRSSKYPLPRGGAPMPYAMFFSKYYAVHGSSDVPAYNASHGCVRVQPSDARWLNQNFLNYGSTVIIRPY